MSAPPLTLHAAAKRVALTELTAIQEISRCLSQITDRHYAAEVVASVVLRITGMYCVKIEGREWGRVPRLANYDSVRSGDVRLLFDSQLKAVEDPLLFAHFLDCQVGNIRELLQLRHCGEKLRTRISRLKQRMETRKLVQRARAIIRTRQGVDDASALRIVFTYCRERGRRLHDVAEAIVIGKATSFNRPISLGPHRRRSFRPGFNQRRISIASVRNEYADR